MKAENALIKKDRMRYTKDKLSANLIIAAIVLDALYFVSIYKTRLTYMIFYCIINKY